MEDDVDFVLRKGAVQQLGIEQVTLDLRDVRGHTQQLERRVAALAGAAVVRDDAVAALEQLPADPGADEAPPTGDERASGHRRPPFDVAPTRPTAGRPPT